MKVFNNLYANMIDGPHLFLCKYLALFVVFENYLINSLEKENCLFHPLPGIFPCIVFQ